MNNLSLSTVSNSQNNGVQSKEEIKKFANILYKGFNGDYRQLEFFSFIEAQRKGIIPAAYNLASRIKANENNSLIISGWLEPNSIISLLPREILLYILALKRLCTLQNLPPISKICELKRQESENRANKIIPDVCSIQ